MQAAWDLQNKIKYNNIDNIKTKQFKIWLRFSYNVKFTLNKFINIYHFQLY